MKKQDRSAKECSPKRAPTVYNPQDCGEERTSDAQHYECDGPYNIPSHASVASRYELMNVIGKGTFGRVYKAYDHKKLQYVALKIVRKNEAFAILAEEEIRILQHIRRTVENNEFIVTLLKSFIFRGQVCLSFELLSMDLLRLIRVNAFRGFSLQLTKRFAEQLLHCLDALSACKVIHCDLKPDNIVLKQPGRNGLKVIDFGSSCFEHEKRFTYIQCRMYRAPEVILGYRYGLSIDMWSLGCILAEFYTGLPLMSGEDEYDQLACIIELIGMPPHKILQSAKGRTIYFNASGNPRYCKETTLPDGRKTLEGCVSKQGMRRGPPGSKDLRGALKGCTDEVFLDFISRCLEWDPDKRLTPEEGLRHQWMKKCYGKTPSSMRFSSAAAHGAMPF